MNHKQRRIIALVLAASCLAALSAACGNKQTTSETASSQAAASQNVIPSSSVQSLASQAELVSSQQVSSSQPASSSGSSKPPAVLPTVSPSDAVAQSAKADPSYLDDAVFIGDSVSLKLKNYVTAKRKSDSAFFGKAQFLTAGSMGSGNALKPLGTDSIHPAYNGKKALLEDSVAAMGVKKVYIMLGMNDIAPYGIEGAVQNMAKLLSKIKEKSPNVTVLVQSATPIVKEQQMTSLNNPNLATYDYKLSQMCKEKGYSFVDVASVMRDKEGNLPLEYCSDPKGLGMHFTDKACEKWIDYILTHTVK